MYGSFANFGLLLFRTKQMPDTGFEPVNRLRGTDFKSVAFNLAWQIWQRVRSGVSRYVRTTPCRIWRIFS